MLPRSLPAALTYKDYISQDAMLDTPLPAPYKNVFQLFSGKFVSNWMQRDIWLGYNEGVRVCAAWEKWGAIKSIIIQ